MQLEHLEVHGSHTAEAWLVEFLALLAATAAKSLQSCPTLCNLINGSPPGSPIPGISRQEHWSGLLFPSPMHESKKWKWSRSVVSDPQRPQGLQPSRLLRPLDFPGKSTGVRCHRLLRPSMRYMLLTITPFLQMTLKNLTNITKFLSVRCGHYTLPDLIMSTVMIKV